jgi:hypothetical protein
MASSVPEAMIESMEVDTGVDNSTRVPKAPTLNPADWIKHKDEIYRIYIRDKNSFKHLKKAMEELRGFSAT